MEKQQTLDQQKLETQQILIVDDDEINRWMLMNMFQDSLDRYELLEAGNGREAVDWIEKSFRRAADQAEADQAGTDSKIVLILLDLMMPIMDGFKVMEYMQERNLIEKIPVILITGETIEASEERAYTFGAADVMHKPYHPHIVKRRSQNIIDLYQSKRNMEIRLKEQEKEIRAQEKEIKEINEFMIDALSTVVESRSAETGDHTKRIKFYTKIMAQHLMEHFPQYGLTQARVNLIAKASVMHDIGKIGISDTVLLKPGRLTPEEFDIMKTHTTIGCDILEKLYKDRTSEFYRYSYEICRHHHERWDGRGYPDHLAGEDIPISAQIVAVADVYDALVSPRVYKSPFPNQKAFEMIMNGECGQFSPDILECFRLAREEFFDIMEKIGTLEFS